MSDAQRYRENAAECERLALKSVGESTRLSFRKMAAEWRALAADAERREGPPPPPSPSEDSKEVE
jgi:hypothetical protein